MKKEIFFICALFLVLTGFNQQERVVEQSNSEVLGRASATTEKPIIKQHLMNCIISEGGIATFIAQYVPFDDPNIKVYWYKNGRPLPEIDRIKTYNEGGYATLVINLVRTDDAGTYTILIRNLIGEASSLGTLTVKTKPATR